MDRRFALAKEAAGIHAITTKALLDRFIAYIKAAPWLREYRLSLAAKAERELEMVNA